QRHGKRESSLPHQVERVRRDVGAQAGVHRVAEGQHAALAEQHVVGQGEDDERAHLGEHRQREAAGENQRCHDEHRRGGAPEAAMPGSVTKALPPITPASPASAAPPPNTSMNTRGTLWPSASTVCGCVSAAWMTSPMRVRVSASQIETSIATDTSIMKPR